ncbi:MAG TPA: hypothetical protein VK893_15330 [Pyrinomonadaceae bacterium]|nr:hypothetical protein [Pyrinomonadaceae bacterium]
MVIRSLLIVVSLLFVSPVLAQFGQSNRLTDTASRLSRDAEDYANAAYNNYTNSTRNNRNDVEALMLAHQFAGASRIFYRMTVDRRRNQDLREAYVVLQNLARSVERYNPPRNTWGNVQRSLSEVGREIGGSNTGPFPDTDGGGSRSGRITWKGRVDDDVRITFRGGTAEVETIAGTEYYDAQPNFSASLPSRRVNVRLEKRRGRGDIFIEQQPSRENDFAVVVRIKDSRGGASDYEFDLVW